jgi:HK97 family phage portal protein
MIKNRLVKWAFGLFARKSIPGVPASQGLQIRNFGGQIVPYTEKKEEYITRGQKGNDIVYSITSLIINTASVAPWNWYTVKDEGAYKRYQAEISKEKNIDWQEAKRLHKKALELYTEDEVLQTLIKYPNPEQTWSELNQTLWLYKLITGDYFEYWEDAPTGGLNKGIPRSLSALPTQYMLIKSGTKLPLAAEAYQMYLGQVIDFTKEQVLHEKYPNLEWDIYGIQLYGQAPLLAALRRLQKNNESQIGQAAAFKNGGERGIVFFDDDRVDPNNDTTFQQMGKNKETFHNEMHHGPAGSGRVWFSPWKVDYKQVGFSPADMEMLESDQVDLRFLCNVWGVPSQLLNDSAAKTFNTLVEAEKALITRCVLPLLCARRDSLNRKFARKQVLDFDLSVYDALQPNKAQQAEWVNKLPLTNKRKLEIAGEDVPETMTEEERNAILIPTGFQLLSDVIGANVDVQPMSEDDINDFNQTT